MDIWNRIIRNYQLFHLVLMLFSELWNFAFASDTRVVTKAPVATVVEGEILSVHCQVWNLQKGQEVTFMRTPEDGDITRIAIIVEGEPLIVGNSGGTVFVAVRQMNDGSVVYFLSILNVAKTDAGKYECNIDDPGANDGDLPGDFVDIRIAYFPSEPGPLCSPGELSGPLTAGDEIVLQCTSEEAYPEVSVQWTRSGSPQVLPSEKMSLEGQSGALLRHTVTEHDSGKIFLCQVTSKSFSSRTASCHVGPIQVIPNPNAPNEPDRPNIKPKYDSTKPPSNSGGDFITHKKQDSATIEEKCWETCSEDSSVMYWILATIAASIFALTFMIAGIIMIFKYYRIPETDDIPKTQYIPTLHTGEEIYVEVESKRCRDKSMYMSLEKPRKPEHLSFPMSGEM